MQTPNTQELHIAGILVHAVPRELRRVAEEWARFKANDSLECRNCHNYDYMDFTRQSPRAVAMHSKYLASGDKTCIDCHKGIAHQLPDMGAAASD